MLAGVGVLWAESTMINVEQITNSGVPANSSCRDALMRFSMPCCFVVLIGGSGSEHIVEAKLS